MHKFLIVVATLVAMTVPSFAQEEASSPTWSQVQSACGGEWRARTDKDTNKGREAWYSFLNECKVRKGYKSKRDRTAVTLPDVN